MAAVSGWSTQQLTEFVAVMAGARSRPAAMRLAVERVAESVEAEIAALLVEGRLVAQVGLPRRRSGWRSLLRNLVAGSDVVEIPGLGPARAASGRLELADEREAWLVVARRGDEAFGGEERALLRGMARILTLSLRGLRRLEDERAARRTSQQQAAALAERQRLLEALGGVQRMIVERAPLSDTLAAVTAAVAAHVGDEVVGLRVVDAEDPGVFPLAAVYGVDAETYEQVVGGRAVGGADGLAVEENRLVVIDDYAAHPAALPGLVGAGVQAAAGAPLRGDGTPIGSLTVASTRAGRRYRPDELAALSAFAELASLAVADAERTRDMLHSALHDGLTGLPNRAFFVDRLERRLLARRRRSAAAVLLVDLDGLKRVNDSLGHAAGDAALLEMGRRLRGAAREADLVARLGSDEFIVLLDTVAGEDAALATADRLLAILAEPLSLADRRISLGASIGVRMAEPGRDRAGDVLRGADLAMHDAKQSGGGSVSLFHPELDQRAVRRLELESELRSALEAGEFRVHYQPIVALPDGAARGVEALVRWDRGRRGLIAPAEFVPLAEETGLIVELGAWVLGEACRTVAAQPAVPSLGVSVNLSARQLLDAGLETTVAAALAASGLAPERLTLEITETVLMGDMALSIERLERLRRLGVRVAIDDFGTGYSSLSYLRRLPIDVVKIDRSFIDEVAGDRVQAALVRAIVDLCHTLELETVAEGVETAAQAQRLAELGCCLAQGYFFGRPRPMSEPMPARAIGRGQLRLASASRPSRPRAIGER